MAKRIKITESQVKLLQSIAEGKLDKKIKITESQYKRLFENENDAKTLQEDGSIAVEFLSFANEAINYLKELLTDPSTAGMSPFWIKMGVTRGELYSTLADAGIIVAAGNAAIEGGKKLVKVRKKNLIMLLKKVYNEFSEKPRYDNTTGEVMGDKQDEAIFLGGDMELSEDYPEGASDDPTAPYNQDHHEYPTSDNEDFKYVKEIFDGQNHTLLFLNDGESDFVVIYTKQSSEFEEFCGTQTNADCVIHMINTLASNDNLEIGECGYDCGSHIIHDLDEEMKSYIMEYHADDMGVRKEFMKLFNLGESTMAAGSSGAFEGPLNGSNAGPIKKTIYPSDELNEDEIDETTTTGASSGAYVQPKIWAKDPKNSRFSKDTMYPGGEIVAEGDGEQQKRYAVEFKGEAYVFAGDDKKAKRLAQALVKHIENGIEGTDVDCGIVRMVEMPFGKEGFNDEPRQMDLTETRESRQSLRESLKLQRDKGKNVIVVISDLEGKEASRETFRNKNALKKAGFRWNGSNWEIAEENLQIAKETLSTLNKAEYLIDELEELEEIVINTQVMDKKSLILGNLEQYIKDLANATDEATLSSEIRRYLTFFSKFHSYSFRNRILIYIQDPNATKVASFKAWKDLNRQVIKGAKALSILAPIFGKGPDDAGEVEVPEELGVKKKDGHVIGYKAVNVFDISQTKATSEDGEVPESPKWAGDNEESAEADELYAHVVEVAESLNINVTNLKTQRGENGYSAGDHINLSSNIAGVGRISTLVHEMAHELMHWRDKSIYYIGDEHRQNKALLELQAESVSYVVLKHFDIPVTNHPTYLALWKANSELIHKNLEVISKVSQFIVEQIEVMSKSGAVVADGVAEKIMNEMIQGLGQ